MCHTLKWTRIWPNCNPRKHVIAAIKELKRVVNKRNQHYSLWFPMVKKVVKQNKSTLLKNWQKKSQWYADILTDLSPFFCTVKHLKGVLGFNECYYNGAIICGNS